MNKSKSSKHIIFSIGNKGFFSILKKIKDLINIYLINFYFMQKRGVLVQTHIL